MRDLFNEEQHKRMARDISDIQRRMEPLGELERKVSRILKELDINLLMKQIQSKADITDMLNEL